jgi:uncharacterized membrane protein
MNEPLSAAQQPLQPSFTLKEIKDRALVLTKKHWPNYVLIGLVGLLAIAPFEVARTIIEINGAFELRDSMNAFEQSLGSEIAVVLLGIVSTVIQMYFAIVITRYALHASEDKTVPFKQYFFFDGRMLLMLLGATMLYVLAILGGFVLLIVPGIILGVAFSMYTYPIVEKNTGAIDALKQSWRMTKGNRWNIFLFGLIVALVGMALVIIPLAVAFVPVVMQMEYGLLITGLIGIVAAVWAIVVSIALGAFNMIASALMYRKMLATRKITA